MVVPFCPGFEACPLLGSAWPGGCLCRSFSGANWGRERGGSRARQHLGPQPHRFWAGSPLLTLKRPVAPMAEELWGRTRSPRLSPLLSACFSRYLRRMGSTAGYLARMNRLMAMTEAPFLSSWARSASMTMCRVEGWRGRRTRASRPGSWAVPAASAAGRGEAPLGTQAQPQSTHPQGLQSIPRSRAATTLLIPAASQGPCPPEPEQSPSPTGATALPGPRSAQQTPYPAEAPWQRTPASAQQPKAPGPGSPSSTHSTTALAHRLSWLPANLSD